MESNECTKCAGKGLIGAGDIPTDLVGKVTTCGECSGSGTISTGTDEVVEAPVEEVVAEEIMLEETPAEEVVETVSE